MADSPTSPAKAGPTTNPTPQSDNPTSHPGPPPPPLPPPQQLQALNPSPLQNPNPNNVNPNNPNPSLTIPSFPGQGTLVNPPPFRPVPQFSPLPNYQGAPIAGVGIPPPGVSAASPGSVPSVPPVMQYQVPVPGQPPNPVLRPPFAPLPNGYVPPPQGTVAPPGIARFPSPYQAIVRPLYPIRPPGAQGVLPIVSRPPMPGIVSVRPIIPPIIRPTVPSITPAEKPQTTVYVGKISPTVEDDFMLSLLRLCGPVKSWKRAQDPSGTPRGFGFCEFESAEGVLRALRLLSKFNIDGQELVLNVNQATREYLERYVEKKSENSRNLKEIQAAGADKDGENAPSDEKNQPLKSTTENSNNDSENDKKESHDPTSFGIVTDEDKECDREALEKLTSIIEERIKTKPLPPPPPPALADGSGNQTSELQAKSKDGDTMENDATEGKIDDETSSDNKAAREQDGPDTISPDRSRRNDRRSRDRERDLKREQERELERYEREAERERVRKEREQRRKIEDAEREFEEFLRDWEYREKEKERQRHLDKEREKERERKRRKEIQYDEDDEEDDRKRWRRSVIEERRRKRLQEKEDDLADRLKAEEEIAVAKRRAEEEKQRLQQRDTSKLSDAHAINVGEKAVVPEEASHEIKDKAAEQDYEPDSVNENHKGDGILQNGVGDESTIPSVAESDTRQSGTAPAKKLGFGLVGSGKRTTVLSVFNEEDDDEAHRDKKMRPLVPIDYSTEELQAIQPTVSGGQPPNLAAAAEYAKWISNVTPKEEKSDAERERSRRTHDRSSHRERDHNYEDVGHSRDENKERALERDRNRENGVAKVKTPDKQKLLDAKQLIDMIPKTKDELFSYEINWSVYDKHELHERMRPWISKKITEFLGEEETTLVDYIVSSTQEHVQASQMLEMLQSILDDEAEMFVLKMWRMLIFEIKKFEKLQPRNRRIDLEPHMPQ